MRKSDGVLLNIRFLVTRKEAAIAQANMELSREGWTTDWDASFVFWDKEIEKAMAEYMKLMEQESDQP